MDISRLKLDLRWAYNFKRELLLKTAQLIEDNENVSGPELDAGSRVYFGFRSLATSRLRLHRTVEEQW
jgi:hypothetical protein